MPEMYRITPEGKQVALIHLSHRGPDCVERIACSPGMEKIPFEASAPTYHRSGDVRAVTCPACQESEPYRQLKAALDRAPREERQLRQTQAAAQERLEALRQAAVAQQEAQRQQREQQRAAMTQHAQGQEAQRQQLRRRQEQRREEMRQQRQAIQAREQEREAQRQEMARKQEQARQEQQEQGAALAAEEAWREEMRRESLRQQLRAMGQPVPNEQAPAEEADVQVQIRLLPDGRVRIHWFIRDPTGPIQTPTGSVMTALGVVRLGGVQGRIACMPELKDITPQQEGEMIRTTNHTDDPRAATCPECLATAEYRTAMQELAELLEIAQ